MLEDALLQVLILKVADITHYVRHENYKIFKLHGSVNWGRLVKGKASSSTWGYDRIISEAASLKVSDTYVMVNHQKHLHARGKPSVPSTIDSSSQEG